MNQKIYSARTLLWHYLKPLKMRVLGLAVLLLGSIGLQLIAPQVVRHFLDLAQSGETGSVLVWGQSLPALAVLFFLTVTGQKIIVLLTAYASENLGWTATNNLRADLAEHVIKLDMGFHKTHTPGELIERVDGDIGNLTEYFSQITVQVIGNILLAVGIIILLFREDWRVGLIGMGYGLFVFLLLRLAEKYVVRFWGEVRQSFAEMFGFLEERMGGLEDIRANGGEAYVMARLYPLLRSTYRARIRAEVSGSVSFVIGFFIYVLSLLATLALGAMRFQQGLITIGTLYLLTYYMGQLERPFDAIRRHISDLQRAYASVGRIAELFQIQPHVHEQITATAPRTAPTIRFEGVSFAYKDGLSVNGERLAVNGLSEATQSPVSSLQSPNVLQSVSFQLEAGKVLGLLGRTGSGKTTMTRLLFRLYDVDGGAICLDGQDVRAMGLSDLRRHVGIVTQDVQLFTATVRDNLTLFQNYNPAAEPIPDSQIIAALERLGLSDWFHALPAGLDTVLQGSQGLSAGEAQLFAFTRVFLRDPKLIILDEASARLDPATEQLLERAIDRLLAERTAIVIAHRLGTVQRADDILILENGGVVENGRRDQLASDPNSRFYQLLQTGLEEVLV
ncbi:MAG: ABC transporter ATP-binding protein [Ardenticatenaceae bacterium]|nr:ABC transporter ATP-binding protein [Ardenticatenaceae bacterium]